MIIHSASDHYRRVASRARFDRVQVMQASHYHIFSLPRELLDTLAPRSLVNRVSARSNTPELPTTFSTGPRACNICQGVTFLDVDQQRAHFRTDWHRYNIKTRLNGGKPVSESAFVQLLDGMLFWAVNYHQISFIVSQHSMIQYRVRHHLQTTTTSTLML